METFGEVLSAAVRRDAGGPAAAHGQQLGGGASMRLNAPAALQSWPGIVHGGAVAALLDAAAGLGGPRAALLDAMTGLFAPGAAPLNAAAGPTGPGAAPLDAAAGLGGRRVVPVQAAELAGPRVVALDAASGPAGTLAVVLDVTGGTAGTRVVEARLTSPLPLQTELSLAREPGEVSTMLVVRQGAQTLASGTVRPLDAAAAPITAWAGGRGGTELPMSDDCLACGARNPLGLRARLRVDDEGVWARLNPSAAWLTGDGQVHPGLAPVLLDEIAWWIGAVRTGEGGVTN